MLPQMTKSAPDEVAADRLHIGVSLPVSGATSAARQGGFCPVELPESWRAAFGDGRFAAADGESLLAVAIGADGNTVIASSQTGDEFKVLALTDHGRTRTVLYADDADPENRQLMGAAVDGRWVVFGVGLSSTRLDKWTVHAWDSTTGKVAQIGRNTPADSGDAAPILQPVLAKGKAAWIEKRPDGTIGLRIHSLADGTSKFIKTGRADTAFGMGDGSPPATAAA